MSKNTSKTGLATEGLPSSRTCVDINVRRVWRTSTRGAAEPWKPSGMGNFCRVHETIETCAFFRSVTTILPTKRPPFWGPFFGPQNGVHSLSLNLICLCPGDLAPVLGSKMDPKTGVVLSAKFCRRAKNSASFDCFRGYATEVLHTAGFPWFYSAASNCSPCPANMYVRTYS